MQQRLSPHPRVSTRLRGSGLLEAEMVLVPHRDQLARVTHPVLGGAGLGRGILVQYIESLFVLPE